MINILLLTVLALVAIAAFAVTCHKEPEKVESCTPEEAYWRYEFGTGEGQLDPDGDVIMHGSFGLGDYAKAFGLKTHYLNDLSKADYSDLEEAKKDLIKEIEYSMPPDYKKAYDMLCADQEAEEAKKELMLRHLKNKFYHKPKL